MFSVEKFYLILYTNLLKNANYRDLHFYPFGTTSPENLVFNQLHRDLNKVSNPKFNICFYYDQEPIAEATILKNCQTNNLLQIPVDIKMLAVSEHSDLVDQVCATNNFHKWYYFFHGFAALDWYRDFQYFSQIDAPIYKVFISYNRLLTKDRSYRLTLASRLLEKGLQKYGKLSLHLEDHGLGTWDTELKDPNSRLSESAKYLIDDQIRKLPKSLIIDIRNPPGTASADSGIEYITTHKTALWHLVTETVFYDKKLHLTEKIFKPIVSKRPFILVAAPGNLAYLKSYGFKTFDKYIDESYDSIQDHDLRIDAVVNELEKLCQLGLPTLKKMYEDMQEILEFNFNHFYNEFRIMITDELINNFAAIHPNLNINYSDVRKILLR